MSRKRSYVIFDFDRVAIIGQIIRGPPSSISIFVELSDPNQVDGLRLTDNLSMLNFRFHLFISQSDLLVGIGTRLLIDTEEL